MAEDGGGDDNGNDDDHGDDDDILIIIIISSIIVVYVAICTRFQIPQAFISNGQIVVNISFACGISADKAHLYRLFLYTVASTSHVFFTSTQTRIRHYNDVTWTPRRLKQSATVQQWPVTYLHKGPVMRKMCPKMCPCHEVSSMTNGFYLGKWPDLTKFVLKCIFEWIILSCTLTINDITHRAEVNIMK